MIGKTIQFVFNIPYGDYVLYFTDGTALRIESYGEGGVDLNEIDAEQRRREAAERQGERHADWLHKLIVHARSVAKARERLEAAAMFDLGTEHGRAGFVAWEEWRYYVTPFVQAMKEAFSGAARDEILGMSRLLWNSSGPPRYHGQWWSTEVKDTRTELQKRVDRIIQADREVLERLR